MAGPLKLKLSKKLKGEGYWAHLGTRREMGYAEVLEEVSRESRSVFSPELLRMAFETVMESMVRNILKDGVSRTAGEYFKLRLDVKGTFDSPYDYFDEKKHSLVLNLQVLKGLKRKAKGSLVSREYVPVELTAVRNPGGEAGGIWADAISVSTKSLKTTRSTFSCRRLTRASPLTRTSRRWSRSRSIPAVAIRTPVGRATRSRRKSCGRAVRKPYEMTPIS